MNHFDYIKVAYSVFAVVLAWDYVVPRVRFAQTKKAIAARLRREAAKKSANGTTA
ncbi:MAG TPA: heme exporter protein CcmD [Arenimonas sp.]|uniref:heme exporter protein CcmD n=1 Tax=Arenimonas sp. TaxID=1872635 RepID=UPI002CEA4748|nr:heme exporter protein CcmD [Arenimonas sp.]HMB56637.1 heme exporter protein CcmD [Arenimonas sp.]